MKTFCFASMFFVLIATINPAIADLTGIQILSEQYCVQGDYMTWDDSNEIWIWYDDSYNSCSNNSSGISGSISSDSLENPYVHFEYSESSAGPFYAQADAGYDHMFAYSYATASLSFQPVTSGWLRVWFDVDSYYPDQSDATLHDVTAGVQLFIVHDYDYPVSPRNLWLDKTHVYSLYLTAFSSSGDASWAVTILSFTPVPAPGFVLHDPNGGENLLSGDLYPVNWSNTGSISEVLIEYSADNGNTWADVNTVLNTGSYDWIVPALNSSECLVRISDANNATINDVSDAAFTITDSARFVPSEYDTIQAAIDDSNDRDTVIVAPGTYTDDGDRDIDFKGKAITLRSENPNDPDVVAATIIDCNGTETDPHRGFYFHSGEDANSILEGFTITNGYGPNEPFGASAYSAGGAIYCISSSPTIRNCVFANNYSHYWGGAVHCDNSSAVFSKCTFKENVSFDTGGGLYNRISSITVTNCLFTDNSAAAGGGMYNIDGTSTVKNTIFVGNSAAIAGGGLRNKRVASTIANCTFFDNQSPAGGAVHNVLTEGTTIANCILWDNPDTEIEGDAEVTYCDVKDGWPGEGNIDADPCFADASAGDYHLKSQAGRWDPNSEGWVYDNVTSQCIDTGNPGSPLADEPSSVHNVRVNMGAYGGTTEASTTPYGWGLLADLTNDRIVNFEDFACQAQNWGHTGSEQPNDLNRDGIVDIADANLFAHCWLQRPVSIPSDMRFIPAGEFDMGDSFEEGGLSELPVHRALLDSFYMGKHEITNQQYCDYLNSANSQGLITVTSGIVYKAGSGTSYPYCDSSTNDSYSQISYNGGVFSVRTKGERSMSNDPMVCVSWYGAGAYCNWRSQQEGKEQCYNLSTWTCDFNKKGYRLATEAEREYAARGGLSGRRFPWGDTITHSQANYYSFWSGGHPYFSYDVNPTEGYHPTWNDGIEPYTSPGGSFSANWYGLYDMAGNVWEWCNDWYSSSYYSSSPPNNPTGPTSGTFRVIRGGHWDGNAPFCRVASRNCGTPTNRIGYVGFRLVQDLN